MFFVSIMCPRVVIHNKHVHLVSFYKAPTSTAQTIIWNGSFLYFPTMTAPMSNITTLLLVLLLIFLLLLRPYLEWFLCIVPYYDSPHVKHNTPPTPSNTIPLNGSFLYYPTMTAGPSCQTQHSSCSSYCSHRTLNGTSLYSPTMSNTPSFTVSDTMGLSPQPFRQIISCTSWN